MPNRPILSSRTSGFLSMLADSRRADIHTAQTSASRTENAAARFGMKNDGLKREGGLGTSQAFKGAMLNAGARL